MLWFVYDRLVSRLDLFFYGASFMMQSMPRIECPSMPAQTSNHPYLKQRPGYSNWYYSRWTPAHLQGPGRPKIHNISLRTSDRALALKAYAKTHADVEATLTRWESEAPQPPAPTANGTLEKLSTTTLRRLIAEHKERVLEADLAWRASELDRARADEKSFADESLRRNHDDPYYRMMLEDAAFDEEFAYDLHKRRRERLEKLRRAHRIGDLSEAALSEAMLTSPVRASIAVYGEEDQRRLLGHLRSAEIDVLHKIDLHDEALIEKVRAEVEAVRVEKQNASATWEACIEAWEKYHSTKKGTESSRKQIRASLERFAEWVAKPPAEVTRDDVRRWVDKRLADGLSLKTISSRDLAELKSMYKRAIGRGVLARGFEIPASDLDLPKSPAAAVPTRGFNDDESAAILSAAVEATDPLFHWVPILQHYSGVRVSELTHLRPGDVKQVEGVWCFCPTLHEDERTQKTGFSQRAIPLHPAILDDFLAFVKRREKEGATWLFIRSSSRQGVAKEKPAKKANERLARWVHKVTQAAGFKIGVKYGVEPNHAWRYRFATLCERVGISDDVQRWFEGHSARDAHGGYKKPDVKAMWAALQKFPSHI